MKLGYCIKNKFPDSEAEQFVVWDDDYKRLFDSEEYASGNYDKELLKCSVESASVSSGPFGVNATMNLYVNTGAVERRELKAAALKLQDNCKNRKCKGCLFWTGSCQLGDKTPSEWILD